MKSFKEFILNEDILNWYIREYYAAKDGGTNRTKNGNLNMSNKVLSKENLELAKSTFRDQMKGKMRDEDIDKIQAAGISNTQQYKMAGNSIVVNVLEAIFKNLFMEG